MVPKYGGFVNYLDIVNGTIVQDGGDPTSGYNVSYTHENDQVFFHLYMDADLNVFNGTNHRSMAHLLSGSSIIQVL